MDEGKGFCMAKVFRRAARRAAHVGTRAATDAAVRAARAKAAAGVAAALAAGACGIAVVAGDAADSAWRSLLQIADIESDSQDASEAHAWSYSQAPSYYTVRGKAKTSPIKVGKVSYSKLDSLGRTQQVTAKVTYKMVADSRGWREDMPAEADQITGWGHNRKVTVSLSNGRTYNGYAYNRSHLLADSLGGHAQRTNLVTGTRMQNVGNNDQRDPGGMAYTETLARDYLYKHRSGWVYYRATPVYKGSELVCRSVYVDIKSDDGSVDQRVEVYNAMRGYKVDYASGEITES